MTMGMPKKDSLDREEYEPDEDGLPRAIVGPWVRDKHIRLERYIGISRSVRKKFIGPKGAGATFIDLFAGPGRARIKGSAAVVDGSALAAWRESVRGNAAFSKIYIADANSKLLAACETRLKRAGAQVSCEVGDATETVSRIVRVLNPLGLHFAFLDPYNLGSLSFEVIKKLAGLRRMDILLHVSALDLQMNLRTYMEKERSPLDAFAPGWREEIDPNRSDELIRGKLLEHWRGLLKSEGMSTTETHELVVGTRNQRLYWLAFAARHNRALDFWDKIRNIEQHRQRKLI